MRISLFLLAIPLMISCNNQTKKINTDTKPDSTTIVKHGYSDVNGIKMYYEIHGQGKPLVLIHGGGSTIETTYGRLIPLLAPYRQVIALELQAHGHTGDRNSPLTFEQDADDVVALLKNLHIAKADFLGFSNGGQTLIEVALRHPDFVNKLIIASAFYKRSAVAIPHFWEGFEHATLKDMPQILQNGQLKANGNNQEALLNSFNRDVQRMKSFKGWTAEQIKAITPPVLIITATHDVGSVEHAVEMYRTIPNCEIAVLPGNHGTYLGALEGLTDGKMPKFNAAEMIIQFLEK
jgi:pimeloyl-ACP methyl ester carboxylesterase